LMDLSWMSWGRMVIYKKIEFQRRSQPQTRGGGLIIEYTEQLWGLALWGMVPWNIFLFLWSVKCYFMHFRYICMFYNNLKSTDLGIGICWTIGNGAIETHVINYYYILCHGWTHYKVTLFPPPLKGPSFTFCSAVPLR
jgi:hypothetical protein